MDKRQRAGEPRQTDLAARLARVHLTGERTAAPEPGQPPADISAAYAVQTSVAARLGERIAGWKVAISPQGPVVAPIYERLVSESGAVRRFGRPDIAGVEFELAVRLRPGALRRLPIPWRPNAAAPEIEEIMVGVEFVGGRYTTAGAVSFMPFLADNLGNAGYVTGEPIARDRAAALATESCRVCVDGTLAYEGRARHADGDPLAPLGACVEQLAVRSDFQDCGEFITTGSLCGVVPVDNPSQIEASIPGVGRVACFFE